jgi:hypothetical protein
MDVNKNKDIFNKNLRLRNFNFSIAKNVDLQRNPLVMNIICATIRMNLYNE